MKFQNSKTRYITLLLILNREILFLLLNALVIFTSLRYFFQTEESMNVETGSISTAHIVKRESRCWEKPLLPAKIETRSPPIFFHSHRVMFTFYTTLPFLSLSLQPVFTLRGSITSVSILGLNIPLTMLRRFVSSSQDRLRQFYSKAFSLVKQLEKFSFSCKLVYRLLLPFSSKFQPLGAR